MGRERARGALLGLAVGDALGTTLEFQRPAAPPFPAFATGPHRDLKGGGPFNLSPGQVSDDTQMACALAASLLERGCYDPSDAARKYVEWLPHAFDVGIQTRQALLLLEEGVAPQEAGRRVWVESRRHAAGNGSLMRAAPIAVFFAADPSGRRVASLADSVITHYDPRCRIACASFTAAIAAALRKTGAPDPGTMLSAAQYEIGHSAFEISAHGLALEAEEAYAALHEDLQLAQAADPLLYGSKIHLHRDAGFVRVAFRLAFWQLLHAPTFEAGLVDIVNRGGDADTNGAIAGALLGAPFGEDAIPQRWREAVLSALQHGPPGALRDRYHPKRLLELAVVA